MLLPIPEAVVLIGFNLFRSTICKMMSSAATTGTVATSHGSPIPRTHNFVLELVQDADELDKGIRIVGVVMWFYGAKTAGLLLFFGCEMENGEFY